MMTRVALSVLMFLTPAIASATTITIDNFETGNLNTWNPVGFGQIVVDPLNSSNHALNFSGLGDGGNIWTAATYAATGNDWWFSFDYLGYPLQTDTGGFIGWDTDQLYAGTERWLGGTNSAGGALVSMIDDGTWHHYVIHLTRTPGSANLPAGAVYFKAEDWIHSSDHIAGNAFFDNFAITDVSPTAAAVPEPSSLVLLTSGLVWLIARRTRR